MIGPISQCFVCSRFRGFFGASGQAAPSDTEKQSTCTAFPDGIPEPILAMKVDHREPFEGDHGLQWKSDDGEPYPEESLIESP